MVCEKNQGSRIQTTRVSGAASGGNESWKSLLVCRKPVAVKSAFCCQNAAIFTDMLTSPVFKTAQIEADFA